MPEKYPTIFIMHMYIMRDNKNQLRILASESGSLKKYFFSIVFLDLQKSEQMKSRFELI